MQGSKLLFRCLLQSQADDQPTRNGNVARCRNAQVKTARGQIMDGFTVSSSRTRAPVLWSYLGYCKDRIKIDISVQREFVSSPQVVLGFAREEGPGNSGFGIQISMEFRGREPMNKKPCRNFQEASINYMVDGVAAGIRRKTVQS